MISPIGNLRLRSETVLAVGMVAMLGIMLMPLPPFVLDMLLSVSVALAVVIMITAVFVMKPLDFFVFPSLLLMTTLFRLSLNVATTRLILLKGAEGPDAVGQVIKSFGNFVVGGNYAVGFIIFLILVVVNFMVITKGSGRIAEVSARFTLDAMPGKQMAIDADLNSGLIDEADARARRATISEEADFYGAMDGASKFVRGDAIAGLMITAINIIGGLIIGTVQQGMAFGDAARTYTILTVGDGLVTQIPALLISTAAGLVVSRAGRNSNLGRDITDQMLLNPRALFTAAGILFAIGLVPGLPHLPFLIIAVVAGALAYIMPQVRASEEDASKVPEPVDDEPTLESLVELDPLALEIGYGLIPLVEEDGQLLAKLKGMRRQLATELGFIVPSIHIKDNLQLRPHEYSFQLRGVEVARSEVMMNRWLAVNSSGTAEKLEGMPTKEPAFGLDAYWIEESAVERAQVAGYMVVDPATVMTTHLTELVKGHGWELLSRTEVQGLLDNVSRVYPKLVDELVPAHMTLGSVQRVLQGLLRERVAINDLVSVLETLLDYAPGVKDTDVLIEHVRATLNRVITKQYMSEDGSVPVFTLDPKFEGALLETVEGGGAVGPDLVNRLIRGIEGILRREPLRGTHPIILCSVQVRRFLKRVLERVLPTVVVLSNAEISPSARLYTMGMVRYED